MIKGLQFIKSARPGKPVRWFVYAWKGGPRIMTAEGPRKPNLTPDALQAYQEAKAPRPKHTIAGLISEYRRSEEWKTHFRHFPAKQQHFRAVWNQSVSCVAQNNSRPA